MYAFDRAERRELGGSGLQVSGVCIGSGALGSFPQVFGYETPESQAIDTVLAALGSPLNFYDTSAGYSDGESERRIGKALRRVGGLPADWVLATKVDPVDGRFDGEAVRRSVEGSLERLGVDSVHLLHLHDPERISFDEAMGPHGPVRELIRIRDEGIAEHLGVAGGPVGMLLQFLETGVFEAVLTHNRYTLLDRTAEPLLQRATELGIGVLQAAPFGGGILAKGPGTYDTYAYQPMTSETRRRAEALFRVCSESGIPVGAAALQFSLRDERITSTVVGVTKPARIHELLEWASWPIPDSTWAEIEANAGADAGLDNSTT
ncbi:MAG: aldo/keto reductase [Propionibacteriaceae bacterium]